MNILLTITGAVMFGVWQESTLAGVFMVIALLLTAKT